LNSVIHDIEQDVEPKIKAGHAETQQAIDDGISALDLATKSAVEKKEAADTADGDWFNCVRGEKVDRETIEEAEIALENARTTETEACQLEEDRKDFSWQPSQTFTLSCDFEGDGTCDSQLANYKIQMDELTSGLRADTEEPVRLYVEAAEACQTAKDDHVAKQSALDSAVVQWNTKKQECLNKHESRQVSMCIFGTELQRKCGKVDAYNTILAEIDQTGGVRSHPDRVAEWTTTHMTTCMLRLVVEGAQIDTAGLETCESSADYAADVGTLVRREDERDALTTPDKFTCAESTITFGGETWTIPGGDAPASSGYVTEPYHPAVNLALGSVPFTFCTDTA